MMSEDRKWSSVSDMTKQMTKTLKDEGFLKDCSNVDNKNEELQCKFINLGRVTNLQDRLHLKAQGVIPDVYKDDDFYIANGLQNIFDDLNWLQLEINKAQIQKSPSQAIKRGNKKFNGLVRSWKQAQEKLEDNI